MKKIIYNKLIPFKGYVAINLFGIIFARKEYKAQIENNYFRKATLLNHELIHTAQYKELLYVFYLLVKNPFPIPHFAPKKALFAPVRVFCHSFYGIVELSAEGIPYVGYDDERAGFSRAAFGGSIGVLVCGAFPAVGF